MLADKGRAKTTKAIACAVFALASLVLSLPLPVVAQAIIPANDVSYALQQQQQTPLPPPPGSGNGPQPVTPGDGGGPPPVPTGQADQSDGVTWAGRNNRQEVSDTVPPRTAETPLYDFQGPLPTVRTFSRYLVILGVVMATVFMAFAATAVVFGHPYAGSRVIGAMGGLILLLCGYTIWKIVQLNTMHANSTGQTIRQQAQKQKQQRQQPDTPQDPNQAPNVRPLTNAGGTIDRRRTKLNSNT